MQQKTIVYVVNRKGKPLMPTTRCGHVRKLLKAGIAVPICNNPFTIRLRYDTPDVVQPLYLGLDTGRENIGIAVSDEKGGCLYLSELRTSNKSIKKKMDERREFRSERRRHKRIAKQRRAIRNGTTIQGGDDDILRSKKPCKSKTISYPGMEDGITCKVIQGAEAQSANRKKPEGWVTPSGRQLIQMHMNAVRSAMEILPIAGITIERVCFDFQRLENAGRTGWDHSKGPLYGFKDYKDYIKARQGGRCLLCGKENIEYYHHIVPRKRGGSDTVGNIAGLCYGCHYGDKGIHKDPHAQERLEGMKAGLYKKYRVSLLNSVMPLLAEEMDSFCRKNGIKFSVTSGYATSQAREKLQIPKEHCLDAYCISLAGRKASCGMFPDAAYEQQRFKKKSKNIINTRNSREYYRRDGNGLVLVAKNRHRALDQESPSLEEHLAEYAGTHSEYERIAYARSLVVKPCRRTYTFHRDGVIAPIHAGDVVRYEKRNKIKGNTKTDVFVATGVKVSDGVVRFGTKSRRLQYCRRIKSGCTPYVDKNRLSLKAQG